MANINWQAIDVKSPGLTQPVSVLVARDVPYISNPNRFQNLSIYLLRTAETTALVGTPFTSLPIAADLSSPKWHVHIHGGAWRDPNLTSASIEAAVAHAFSNPDSPIRGIVSLNYTLTQFPTHPEQPYDTVKNNRSDPSRDGRHPDHVRDVLRGFSLLRSLGITDGSYILTGHSAGACLAFQAVLVSPQKWGFAGDDDLPDAPRPAVVMGLNGLYDLPQLVHGLGASHAHLRAIYAMLLGNAFGADESAWPAASPAQFDADDMTQRVKDGKIPTIIVLDQSTEDQLVPMNQRQRLATQLESVSGIRVVMGKRCVSTHAAPWEQGYMIWESVQDALELLRS